MNEEVEEEEDIFTEKEVMPISKKASPVWAVSMPSFDTDIVCYILYIVTILVELCIIGSE